MASERVTVVAKGGPATLTVKVDQWHRTADGMLVFALPDEEMRWLPAEFCEVSDGK